MVVKNINCTQQESIAVKTTLFEAKKYALIKLSIVFMNIII